MASQKYLVPVPPHSALSCRPSRPCPWRKRFNFLIFFFPPLRWLSAPPTQRTFIFPPPPLTLTLKAKSPPRLSSFCVRSFPLRGFHPHSPWWFSFALRITGFSFWFLPPDRSAADLPLTKIVFPIVFSREVTYPLPAFPVNVFSLPTSFLYGSFPLGPSIQFSPRAFS